MNAKIEKIYGLSPMQEGILYHKQIDEKSTAYVIQLAFKFAGELDAEKTRRSLGLLAKKYEALRTAFIITGKHERPLQVVIDGREIEFAEAHAGGEEEKARLMEADVARGFDLTKDSLLRVTLLRSGRGGCSMVWTAHHIIIDGWCISLLLRDFIEFYGRAGGGGDCAGDRDWNRGGDRGGERGGERGEESPLPYSEYIKWLEKQNKKEALDYWEKLLEGYETAASIPPVRAANAELADKFAKHAREHDDKITKHAHGQAYGTHEHAHDFCMKTLRESLNLPDETAAAVRNLAASLNVTVNTIVEAAWGILLQKYNGTGDAVFGKVVSGRNANLPGIEQAVGLFVNTVPARVEIRGAESVRDLLRRLQAQSVESMKYEYAPLAEVQSRSRMGRDLVQTLFAFENYYVDEAVYGGVPGFEAGLESLREEVNYDISITAYMRETLRLDVMYNSAIYAPGEAKRLLERLSLLLGGMAANPDAEACRLSAACEDERDIILSEFCGTYADYPRDKTVAALFEEQAAKRPASPALIYGGEIVTYRELNEKANALAHKLRDLGVGPDDIVAVIAGRGIETVAGMLAIVKAGGAYAPIDPGDPAGRKLFMLKDCKPKAVLAAGGLDILLQSTGRREANDGQCVGRGFPDAPTTDLIAFTSARQGCRALQHDLPVALNCDDMLAETPIIDLLAQEAWLGDAGNPSAVNKPDDLLYCIYTSGTTGEPKGSLIEHKSAVRLVRNQNYVKLNENTVMLQTGSMAFDASTFEVWGALLNGGALVMAGAGAVTDEAEIRRLIGRHSVNTMWMTSSLFNIMIQADETLFDDLDYLLIGGEKLSDSHVRTLKNRGGKVTLINGYGPTENTTFTTAYEIPARFESIPIGRPIANTQVYIMDGGGLCGVGMPGELRIAGDGLARGYLNRPELTAEKFVPNPFGEGMLYKSGDLARWLPNGSRLYRSGDLARWLPDGNIEFLGRIDDQFKIRGFRIEPGEIESALRRLPGISGAAVVARGAGGDKRICAYVTAETDAFKTDAAESDAFKIDAAEIDALTIKEALRKELPEYMIPASVTLVDALPLNRNGKLDIGALPEPDAPAGRGYAAPRTETERAVAEAFEAALGVSPVGADDSFFDLGGHSLKAGAAINAIEQRTGVRLPMKLFFGSPTPRMLAAEIGARKSGGYTPIPIAGKKEYYAASSAQRRLFILDRLEGGSAAYNMPAFFEASGELDLAKAKKAFADLIARHEALRTRFALVGGEPVQIISDTASREPEYEEVDSFGDDYAAGFVRPFDLGEAPLIRLKIVKERKSGRHRLLFDMHHIISDGMTVNILAGDFSRLYAGGELPPAAAQYKDYSEWARSRPLESQRNYWLKIFGEEAPILDMAADYPRPKTKSYRGARVTARLSRERMRGIEKINAEFGTTDFMTLLAAFIVELHKYTRQEDIVVGAPISGRAHKDAETMAGMFVNTLALRAYPRGGKTFAAFLGEVKECALGAYENQEYAFEELAREAENRRDMSRNPLFDVMFALQNNEAAELKMGAAEFRRLETGWDAAKFDLTLQATPGESGYELELEYCRDLYTEPSARHILEHYLNLVDSISANPEAAISDLRMTGAAEYERIIAEFNDTYAEYPDDKTLAELFEEQAARTPGNVALEFENESMTYGELNAKANRLAHRLRKAGVAPDDRIALIAERGMETIEGILGIVKAGGAYVPMDPGFPANRIRYMLEDCAPKAVLTYGAHTQFDPVGASAAQLDRAGASGAVEAVARIAGVLALDLGDAGSYDDDESNPRRINSPSDLAYVIYTSGTTGNPKGVMIEHRGVANLLEYFKTRQKTGPGDCVLQFANIVFDAHVSELLMGLFTGAKLVLMKSGDTKDPDRIAEIVEACRITALVLPPQLLNLMRPVKPRILITAGSAAIPESVRKLDPSVGYSNDYGPTEATVCATHWAAPPPTEAELPANIPIGRPIGNVRAYVMNGEELCGIGVPGELCVAGAGLARGYLNQPVLTSEKFTAFLDGRLYRTGDLARWLPDGNIEYLGRIDEQVKIRGFRIEPGEIESALRKQPGVAEAAVIAKDIGGDKCLCAYVAPERGAPGPDPAKIKDALRSELPEYMIPAFIIPMDGLPLNKSGKLDRGALPEPEAPAGREYIPPRNDTERDAAEAFGEVLGVSPVGIEDSFFELGGDSIKAIRAVSLLRDKGYELAVMDLIRQRTVRLLCENIGKTGVKTMDVVFTRANADGGVGSRVNADGGVNSKANADGGVISNAGKNVGGYDETILAQIKNSLEHYCDDGRAAQRLADSRKMTLTETLMNDANIISDMTEINSGARRLAPALKDIISKQGILRMKIDKEAGRLEEYEYSDSWEIPVIKAPPGLSAAEFSRIAGEINFTSGVRLLSRFAILDTGEDRCVLLSVVHHMVWDLVSQDLFKIMVHEALSGRYDMRNEYSYIKYGRALEEEMKGQAVTPESETEIADFFEAAQKESASYFRPDIGYITKFRLRLNGAQAQKFTLRPIESAMEFFARLIYGDALEDLRTIPYLIANIKRNESNSGELGLITNTEFYMYRVAEKAYSKIPVISGHYLLEGYAPESLRQKLEKYDLMQMMGTLPIINYLGIYNISGGGADKPEAPPVEATAADCGNILLMFQFSIQNGALNADIFGMAVTEGQILEAIGKL